MTGSETAGYPLLLDLRGRRVVVVGGGPVAARRAYGLLDAGALVTVVAPWVCEPLAEAAADGRITWYEREYAGASDLDGAWLVHTATGDRGTDARVRTDAEAARVLCVDAGSGAEGSAQVPAVARVRTPDGPVTVAVNGHHDPRRAQAVRDAVARGLEDGTLPLRAHRPRRGTGWVALVGGGPGPTDLLTTRGRTLLAAADVVVVDRLGARGVLDQLDPDVLVVDVGKTAGHHPWPQHEIEAELVRHAQAGKGVVRLKGGDPFVLGRGGEEVLACEAAGVPVEVVPGVTSAVSVPAAAGIPVTHRGLARGFSVVTGHDDLGEVPAARDHTLVLLMAVTALPRSCAALLAAGRDPATPVAVVEDGYGDTQRVTTGRLDRIAAVAAAVGVRAPAVVVVGDVVTLSPAWPPPPDR
jgi:uroporphyrin-III C-methyltransferase/precorrin-2 dehydrogenase/sirohydrochlorin ferrochelatase